jgi:RimJ/RimL family protein N-acetyltransferase
MKWICGDQAIAKQVGLPWAQDRIGVRWPWNNATAIMLFDAELLLACTVYADYDGGNILMHIASDGSRRWLTRDFLRECFAYPFEQLHCRRVTGLVAASNTAALKFDAHLGFKPEGRMRQAAQDGSDLLILGMLRHECRHLRGRNGKQKLAA